MSDERSNGNPGEVLSDDECPVCHGLLSEKNGVPWCPNCDLTFTP